MNQQKRNYNNRTIIHKSFINCKYTFILWSFRKLIGCFNLFPDHDCFLCFWKVLKYFKSVETGDVMLRKVRLIIPIILFAFAWCDAILQSWWWGQSSCFVSYFCPLKPNLVCKQGEKQRILVLVVLMQALWGKEFCKYFLGTPHQFAVPIVASYIWEGCDQVQYSTF